MKKRTQSGSKKTLQKGEQTLKKSKGRQIIQKSSKMSLNQHTDVSQQSLIELETFSKPPIQNYVSDRKLNDKDDLTKSFMVESFENIIDYDPAIMEEIEKEIYEAQIQRSVTPIDKLRDFEQQCVNDQEILSIGQEDKFRGQIKESQFIKSSQKEQECNPKSTQKDFIPNESIQTQKISSQSEEEQIIVPKKTSSKNAIDQKSLNKLSEDKSLQTQTKMAPLKKLKSNKSSQSKKFVNFTINLKLLRSNFCVKKIIKCLESDKIYDRQTAQFLIETQNGEQHVLSNAEMVSFYKDALIEYYQGIHFS